MAKSQEEIQAPNTGKTMLANDTKPLLVSQVNLLVKIITADYAALRMKIEHETAALVDRRKKEIIQERYKNGGEAGLQDVITWLREEEVRLRQEWTARLADTGYTFKYGRDDFIDHYLKKADSYRNPAEEKIWDAQLEEFQRNKQRILRQINISEQEAKRAAMVAGVEAQGSAQTILDRIPRAEDILRQLTEPAPVEIEG